MITRESPLRGMKMGTAATVIIRELPGLLTIDLRVEPGSPAREAVSKALAMELPAKVGQSRRSGEAHALCLAPDWWLVIGLDDSERKLASLRSNASNESQSHYSAVNVSGQRTTIELEGPNAREVLSHLWEQDLREKSFPVGSVSQGLMAKAPVIVYHVDTLRYRVMVRSSFALHLWKALVDAGEEWCQ